MLIRIIGRNLRIYFRDKAAVFFSMLSVFIVVFLFILFLAQLQVDNISKATPNVDANNIAYLVHSWILAGLLSLTTVTSVLGGYGSMVNDRNKKIIMSFKSAPISAWVYPISNVISSFVIGVLVSLLAFAVYYLSIFFICEVWMPLNTVVAVIQLILFSSIISSLSCGCICSFLKTNTAFSSVSILIGTCLGFINGLYVPIGSLSKTIVDILAMFPSLHIATLFRKTITEDAVSRVFENAPTDIVEKYLREYGITLSINGIKVETLASILFAIMFAIICAIIMVIKLKKTSKEI